MGLLSVLRWLRIHGIEVRPTGSNIRRRNLAYGLQLKKRRETIASKEVENIQKMRDLRNQGYSYWKIADILNSMKVPTKTGKGAWQARTIQRILDLNAQTMNAHNNTKKASRLISASLL